MIKINNPIPDFSIVATGDKTIKLSNLRGKNILLYFYPKNNTPSCTIEGQNFRDNIAQFEAMNTVIFGISRDTIKSHENFKRKQKFTFDLLADTEEQLCQLFTVIKIKNMFGMQVRGIERSTFLIDQQGVLIHEWRKVKVKKHLQEVLDVLAKLSNSSVK